MRTPNAHARAVTDHLPTVPRTQHLYTRLHERLDGRQEEPSRLNADETSSQQRVVASIDVSNQQRVEQPEQRRVATT